MKITEGRPLDVHPQARYVALRIAEGKQVNRKFAMDDHTYDVCRQRAATLGLTASAYVRRLVWKDHQEHGLTGGT